MCIFGESEGRDWLLLLWAPYILANDGPGFYRIYQLAQLRITSLVR
jgi:hypothetical protein